jgi:hypothetical protein
MAQKLVFVTGLKQLDDLLAGLEPKTQKKFTRQALRKSAKRVVEAIKEIVYREAYNLGVLYESFKVRALKRSRRRFGVSMFVDREKLFAAYASWYGHPPNPAKNSTDPWYYLASIEFGFRRKNGREQRAIRPMRRGLYDNEEEIKQYFIADLHEIISETGRKAKPKEQKGESRDEWIESIEDAEVRKFFDANTQPPPDELLEAA